MSDAELDELQEMRREIERREKRIDLRNTEAKMHNLTTVRDALEALKEPARLSGVTSGLISFRNGVDAEIERTQQRIETIHRWQVYSDPESDVYKRVNS